MRCLGINLTKHVQNLHGENYITLMKEIKDLNKQTYHAQGLEEHYDQPR